MATYKLVMNKPFVFLLVLPLLTGCFKNKSSKRNRQEILCSDDGSIKILIDYNSNKRIRKLTIQKDSLKCATIGFNKSGEIDFTGIEKNNRRTHVVEYYPNGRPIGLVNLDSLGTGDGVYYYDNGSKKSEGKWRGYSRVGIWMDYNENGELIKVDTLE